MLNIESIHHVAIICSNYEKSKTFYTKILGFSILKEHYRKDRNSWKLDLKLNDQYTIELFSFPHPPSRISKPEACGLRHVAFAIADLELSIDWLTKNGVTTEPIRTDEYTGKRFTFFRDPDDLPLELYEY
jgi:glyoxylase I family protein